MAPVALAAKVKGRIQHHGRLRGTPIDFSRKLAVRSLGDPTRAEVEAYIRNQVGKEEGLDEQLREMLAEFTVVNPKVDLAKPTESNSGRYWYNLHLVLVMDQRHQLEEPHRLARVRDRVLAIAARKGHALSTLAVMPDHLHLALRGDIHQSPEAIALSLLNNLAYGVGQEAWWQPGYYAGTFGEYCMAAVRPRRGNTDTTTPLHDPGGPGAS